MKINTNYSPLGQLPKVQPQQPLPGSGERNDAEARLRELIAQKHAEFDSFRPVEELGKHLDLRA